MSDSQRIYHKVSKPLKRALKGQNQNHIEVLALMITAIVKGRTSQLNRMAEEAPTKAKAPSTFRRFQRWLANDRVDVEAFYMPFASSILAALSRATIYVAMDASSTAKGCQTLMFGVIYKKRLLPLCWLSYKGKKGHAKAKLHIEGLELLRPMLNKQSRVILVADGEYDNIEVLQWVKTKTKWGYAIRTGKNILVEVPAEGGGHVELGMEKAMVLEKDELAWIENTRLTGQKHGPVMVVGIWNGDYDEPIYLVSNLESAEAAEKAYKNRYIIETLFSDQKGRGFGIDKSHIDRPERLNRLLLATSLAYIWMVYFGVLVLKNDWADLVDCRRQDKSLFRLGMAWLKRLLNQDDGFRAIFHLRGVM